MIPSSHLEAKILSPSTTAQSAKFSPVLLTGLQLALVLLVLHQFQLESRTFFNVMLLGAAGFVIHAFLPLRYRLPFFVGLSLAGLPLALGLVDGAAVFGLGLLLIGVCHLPTRLSVRVVVLLAIALVFAAWRVEALAAPWSVAIWPVLASMFMFRIALYLHALKHDEARPAPTWTLAYFFMLPNVCFPLYPVIDYSLFTRSHYDGAAASIYATGVRWIARGLVHLLLYRYVYQYLVLDPNGLLTFGDLVQFILATFLLYLRVSGQFHIITGVLHLFGFQLPETHHLYYLASSFTDFWRRINIYWKDFMMKLVYYPSFFRLRRHGGTVALVGATVVVFFSTWLLHSYQWFWLRRGFPLEAQDVLFWGILGVLVVVGSLREIKRPRKRSLSRGPLWSWSRALATVGTFSAICLLWSLWSAESVSEWVMMWVVVGNVAPGELWKVAGLIALGLLIAGHDWQGRATSRAVRPRWYRHPALQPTLVLLGIAFLGKPGLYATAAPGLAQRVASLEHSTLNARDAALKHRGYYEKLDNTSRLSAQLWEVQESKPADWVGLSSTPAYHVTRDFGLGELNAGAHIRFLGQPLTVNRWGMRDHDYTLAKPPRTYRIAVLGPSHVMGSGVADGETFTAQLAERLNQAPNPEGMRYEVLNFGVAGMSLLHQLWTFEQRVLRFEPDVVIFTESSALAIEIPPHLVAVVGQGIPIPFEDLDTLIRRTGVMAAADSGIPVPFRAPRKLLHRMGIATRMPWREADHRMRLEAPNVVRWTFRRMAATARSHEVVPVFLGLNLVNDAALPGVTVLQDARSAGLLVFDLFDWWRGMDASKLRIHPADDHLNAEANRLVADRLFDLIQQHRTELRLGSATPQSHTLAR